MEMEIKLGDYELVYSLSVIQIDNSPIQISLPDTLGEIYVITFRFIHDSTINSTITRTNPIDKSHLNVDFVNFYDPEQTGNIRLLEIGLLHENPLFLNYRVTPLKGSSRTILFNFYIRKEV